MKQNHTLDILVGELLCIINWFNPFAWLIRHSIRQNLEFIADDFVLKNGLDKKTYQYHLLKVVGTPQYRIANNFNFSSLKKRIVMMNKLKSAKLHLIKFLFVLPLIAVLLVAFRDKYKNGFDKRSSVCNIKGIVLDISTDLPLSGVTVKEINSGEETTTDRDGLYSFSILIKKNSRYLDFDIQKKGFIGGENQFAYDGNHQGFVSVLGMAEPTIKLSYKPLMFLPATKQLDRNPEHSDLMQLCDEVTQQKKLISSLLDFRNKYPALTFFSSDDKQKQIVILKDGCVEKYGYPTGPTIGDMENKYGKLPDIFTNSKFSRGKDYLEKWKKISEEIETKFHSTNFNVKEIIFPGDSHVIVILKDGNKPEVYDMDNDMPNEQPAFEKQYGKLPDIVPSEVNNNSTRMDTIPVSSGSEKTSFSLHREDKMDKEHKDFFNHNTDVQLLHWTANNKLEIYMVNGSIVIVDLNNANEVMKALSKYGEIPQPYGSHRASVTKIFYNADSAHNNSYTVKSFDNSVLYIIDGIEIPQGLKWASLINPAAIKSMNVLKDEMATKKYGDKGKNGVIEITTNMLTKNKLDTILNTPGIVRVGQIQGNNHPLYIVDGKEAIGIGNLNPNQIESITVLKDSSALKKYGDKGKNGVILIKTKNPQSLNLQNPNSQPAHSDTSYVDDVSVQNGIMNWQINKDKPKHPLYLVNGKVVGKDPKQINVSSADIHIAEFVGKGAKLKQYGKEGEDGVINFVTKSEKDNKAAYIFPRGVSVDSNLIKEFIKEAAITNKLYVGIENPLKISAEDISDKEIIVQMDDKFGQIKRRNGLYSVLAKLPGNAEIKIYQKGKEGSLKLLNSRYFRIEYLPDPVSVIRFNNS